MAVREPVPQATIDSLLSDVDKPARYIGGEVNSVIKPGPVRCRLALCFPDVYEVAESHVGFKILYEIVNRVPDLAAERAYAFWPDLEAKARRRSVPLWSLETHRPLAAFDVVGFTLQYELAYPTILAMLEHGGVPARATARAESDPIVIAGGAGTYNPEPIAPFFDCFLLGDGEEAVLEILDTVAAGRARNARRAEILADLGRLAGIYVPSQIEVVYAGLRVTSMTAGPGFPAPGPHPPRVPRRTVADLDAAPYTTKPIVPHVQPVHERVAIEIQRGCSQGCRFCQPGMTARPTRQRRADTVLDLAASGLTASGCDEVGLLSLSAGNYQAMNDVVAELLRRHRDERIAISLPSMRTETMTPELASKLAAGRRGGFTLAPEAGSERLRRVVNKTNTEQDLLAAVRATVQAGWRSLKLYFMIGLPTETDEDIDAIVGLAERARAEGRAIRNDVNVAVSVSTFVPKPHTSLQWESQIGTEETRRKQLRLRDQLRRRGIPLRYHSPEQSFIEGVLARGDRRLADALELAARAGCRLDAWTELYNHERWMTSLRAGLEPHHLRPEDYLGPRDLEGPLAWDHLDAGVRRKFLEHDRQQAFAEQALDDCALSGQCHACGACDRGDPSVKRDASGERPLRLVPRLFPAGSLHSEPAPASAPQSGRTASTVRARTRLRFRFAKEGPAIHLSHLDSMAQIIRAVRHSALPVLFSEGHVPRPRIGFSPACRTGISSEAEYFEVDCSGFPQPAKYVERINAALPVGLRIREGAEIPVDAPSFNEVLAATSYSVELPASIDWPALEQAIASLRGDLPLLVRILRKGKPKLLDVRSHIQEVRLADRLELTLAFTRESNLKIGEALAVLIGRSVLAEVRITKAEVRLAAEPLPHHPAAPVAASGPVLDLTDLGERHSQTESAKEGAPSVPYAE